MKIPDDKAIFKEYFNSFRPAPHIVKAEPTTNQFLADTNLRIQLVEAMVQSGIAPHVAANRTDTEAKMLAEARIFNLI